MKLFISFTIIPAGDPGETHEIYYVNFKADLHNQLLFFTVLFTRYCCLESEWDNILRYVEEDAEKPDFSRKITIAFLEKSDYNSSCLEHESQLFLWEEGYLLLYGASVKRFHNIFT